MRRRIVVRQIAAVMLSGILLLTGCGNNKDTGGVDKSVSVEAGTDSQDKGPSKASEQEDSGAEVSKQQGGGEEGSSEAALTQEDTAASDAEPTESSKETDSTLTLDKHPEVYVENQEWRWWDENFKNYHILYSLESAKLSKESESQFPVLAEALKDYTDKKRKSEEADFNSFGEDWEKSGEGETLKEDDIYEHKRTLFLRRADGKIYSFAERLDQTEPHSESRTHWEAHTFDVETGKELNLSDFVDDEEALLDILYKRAARHTMNMNGYEENGMEEEKALRDTREVIENIKEEKGLNFTVDPYGISFYFDTYGLWLFPFTETVLFSEDTDGKIFKEDICKAADDWMMPIDLGQGFTMDLNGDGQADDFSVSEKYEGELITGLYFTLHQGETMFSVPTDGTAYEMRAFLVHANDNYWVLSEYTSSNGGAVDLISLEGEVALLSDRIEGGSIAVLPDEETDYSIVETSPLGLPLDPNHIKVLIRDKGEEKEVSVNGEGKLEAVEGTGSPESEASQKTYSSEIEAYSDVLSAYQEMQSGGSDSRLSEMGFHTALSDMGWPGLPAPEMEKNVGYCLYDVDDNGVKELIITYLDSIYDIYGFDGEKPVYAYGTTYRGETALFEDGMIQKLWGSNSGASETWYKMDGNIGFYLPLVDRIYSPTEYGSNKDGTEYHIYGDEKDWEEIERLYREGGSLPVWVYEWNDVISEKEFKQYSSSAKEVKLQGIQPLSEYNGL
ncbi:MAG: hypothetical protein K5989_00040 [Lachnospiraceae bacterium]|nr:hypothetical protein [Lachnospiraceae bacterium]